MKTSSTGSATGVEIILDHLNGRLVAADGFEDEDDAIAEREAVEPREKEAEKAITAFERLLVDITTNYADEESRVIGHVTLSPPICPNYGKDGFTDDWAVIQIHPSVVTKTNFLGNAIDLVSIEPDELTAWMYPHHANATSFKYPLDRLLRFTGTVSDQEMFKPNPKTRDQVLMVLKNGNTSNLTPGVMSKEVAVLPHTSKPGPFSDQGDSGSVVIDSRGRVCGIDPAPRQSNNITVTGGDGATDVSDCTFVTSLNFLIKRLADFGIKANILPLPADL
ncbi:hypothetical protein V8E54_010849 [Elaphomyces granulatus]